MLVSLGIDWSNVLKTTWKLINDHKKSTELPGLTPYVPSTMLVVHNSFHKGLKYRKNVQQFDVDVLMVQDYDFTLEDLGLDEELFIRHVQCYKIISKVSLLRIRHKKPLRESCTVLP